LLALPLLAALAAATAMAFGLILTSLDVRYRDIGHVVPFLLQFWMYASPVGYPADAVPGRLRAIYDLNPMAGVISGFRWALLGTSPPDPWGLALNVATVSALLLAGLAVFRRTEETLADLI
jgi:lipopolysaccharide transport system permease protein